MEKTLEELYDSGDYFGLEDRVSDRYHKLKRVSVEEEKILDFEDRIQKFFEKHIEEARELCRKLKPTLHDGECLSVKCEVTLGDNPSCGEDWRYLYCPGFVPAFLVPTIFSFHGNKESSCESDWYDDFILRDTFYYGDRPVRYGIHHFTDLCCIPLCDLVEVQNFDYKITVEITGTSERV